MAHRLILGSAMMVLCSILGISTAPAQDAPRPVAEWTLLVYLDADNDLEKPMMRNLAEMAAVGSSAAVQVIVLAARSPEGDGLYTNAAVAGLRNWDTAKLLRVETGKLVELADWGHADMGDKRTLARFLDTATKAFPAKRYAVLFGDHGMAWAGIAVAESSDSDTLTIDELAATLGSVTQATGRIDLVGFDACLMANLEVAKTLAPYARVLVASEEIEPADGWDYRNLLARLSASPTMDGSALGRVIVDTYRDQFRTSGLHEMQEKARAATLNIVDLDKVGAVDQALEVLGVTADAYIAGGKHEAWVRMARARHEADEFGRSAMPSSNGVSPGMEVYDVVQLAQKIKEGGVDAKTAANADAVVTAARAAVPYGFHGDARAHANGLSVFFPPNRQTLASHDHNTKKSYDRIDWSASPQNHWYPFLANYAEFPASPEERNRPKPTLDAPVANGRMASPGKHVKIKSVVHSDEVGDVRFVLSRSEGDDEIIIGAIPVKPKGAGALDTEWDGEWFTLVHQDQRFVAPITEFDELDAASGEDLYWAVVPAQLRVAGTKKWLDVTLAFVLDFKEESEDVSGDFIYAVEYTAHGPREIDIEEGDDLRMVYEVVGANGESRLEPADSGDEIMHLEDLGDLKVERDPVEAGTYKVGYVVEDLAGRVTDSFVEVEVGQQ
jgi:hypothetical protein